MLRTIPHVLPIIHVVRITLGVPSPPSRTCIFSYPPGLGQCTSTRRKAAADVRLTAFVDVPMRATEQDSWPRRCCGHSAHGQLTPFCPISWNSLSPNVEWSVASRIVPAALSGAQPNYEHCTLLYNWVGIEARKAAQEDRAVAFVFKAIPALVLHRTDLFNGVIDLRTFHTHHIPYSKYFLSPEILLWQEHVAPRRARYLHT